MKINEQAPTGSPALPRRGVLAARPPGDGVLRLDWRRWLIVLAPLLVVIWNEAIYESFREQTWMLLQPTLQDLVDAGVLLVVVLPFSIVVLRLLHRLEHQIAREHEEVGSLRTMLTERERLSREVHDGSAQVLASVLMSLDTIGALVNTGRTTEAVSELERIRAMADDIYRDTRDVIVGLRLETEGRGLQSSLVDLVEQFQDRTGLHPSLAVDPVAECLPPVAQLQVLRIVREALTNVRKHAHATSVRIAVEGSGSGANSILVTISDNGVGLVTTPETEGGKRLGMLTMRERAESVGGWLGITSLPGGGVTLVAELPILNEEQDDRVRVDWKR